MNNDKIKEARMMLLAFVQEHAKENGITQAKICELTGFKQSNLSRTFSGRFPPTLDTFIAIADAVGLSFFVADKDEPSDDPAEEAAKKLLREN
jgi:transcriptional regulator with XRE-family HTH domain